MASARPVLVPLAGGRQQAGCAAANEVLPSAGPLLIRSDGGAIQQRAAALPPRSVARHFEHLVHCLWQSPGSVDRGGEGGADAGGWSIEGCSSMAGCGDRCRKG